MGGFVWGQEVNKPMEGMAWTDERAAEGESTNQFLLDSFVDWAWGFGHRWAWTCGEGRDREELKKRAASVGELRLRGNWEEDKAAGGGGFARWGCGVQS